MNTKNLDRKGKKIVLRALCVASVVIAAAAVIALSMLGHTPEVYQPRDSLPDNQVSPYLTHKLAPDIHNNIQLDKPFNVIVPQAGFNEIIASGDWPQQFDNVTISRPAIVFAPETILLMGTVDIAGFDTVITIIARPSLDDDGLLTLNLEKVKAGSFNITGFAKLLASGIMDSQLEAVPDNDWLKNLSAAVLSNQPFDPVFPAYDQRIRVVDARIKDKELTLRFVPEK